MRKFTALTLLALILIAPMEARSADFIDPVASIQFVLVKGGQYTRGDQTGSGQANEKPAHAVRTADFLMGKYEVTVDQFALFTEDTGYLTAPEKRGWVIDIDAGMGSFVRREGISWRNPGFEQRGNHPVVWVDWHDALRFARWLSEKTGQKYTLPTEAQWEFAAKGGRSQRWAGTSREEDLEHFAWYASNSGMKTHEVGVLEPNGFGIHDLSGNVWEWCLDGYHDYGVAPHTLVDPLVQRGDTRIIRGGSWRVDAPLTTTTYRNGYKPTYSHSSMGFRLVRGKP